MSPIEVMTRAEVAERLGISIVTVRRWGDEGRLTAIRRTPGLYDRREVEELAAEMAEEAQARAELLRGEKAASA